MYSCHVFIQLKSQFQQNVKYSLFIGWNFASYPPKIVRDIGCIQVHNLYKLKVRDWLVAATFETSGLNGLAHTKVLKSEKSFRMFSRLATFFIASCLDVFQGLFKYVL